MAEENIRSEIDKEKLIDSLTEELSSLRAKIDVSQEELSDIVGISRSTYSAIETKKEECLGMFICLFCFALHKTRKRLL